MKKLLSILMTIALVIVSSPLFAVAPGTINLWQGYVSMAAVTGDAWQNTSLVVMLPGSTRLENSSATTLKIQVGFAAIPAAGTTWDVAHAKIFTTLKGSNKITAVQNLTVGAVAAPYSVDLSASGGTNCAATVSIQNPCLFVFDAVTITTNNAHDYYIIIANSNTVNNQSVKYIKAQDGNVNSTVITYFVAGDATTGLIVGSTTPVIQNTNKWGLVSAAF